MLDTLHPLTTIALAVLTSLLLTSHASQPAFLPIATGQWVWYMPFSLVRTALIALLFACSVLAALSKLVASLLGTGASYAVVSVKWAAYGAGTGAVVLLGTLVAVAWCAAV